MQTSVSNQAAASAPAACASLRLNLPAPLIALTAPEFPRALALAIKACEAEIERQQRLSATFQDSIRLRVEIRHARLALLRLFGLDQGGGECGQPAEVPACSCGIDGTLCHPECPRRDA